MGMSLSLFLCAAATGSATGSARPTGMKVMSVITVAIMFVTEAAAPV